MHERPVGETDLSTILGSLELVPVQQPVTVLHLPEPVPLGEGVLAVITEAEGTTVVATVAEARRRGWAVSFTGAWLTVSVHSSLEAVGLTAALAGALAARGIACNVLAGYFHDHLVVPWDRADEAIECLEALSG
jgi:hypothetical protein